ncbi:MAG: hypothetical protein O7D97_06460 [Planctomycetota bacterium]|nr:hypothetical protein [Planctomycetota bacterium]
MSKKPSWPTADSPETCVMSSDSTPSNQGVTSKFRPRDFSRCPYVQFQQIDHSDTTDPDDSLELAIDYTVTGPDGTADATATLTIEDDGPNARVEGSEGTFGDDMISYDESDEDGADEVEELPPQILEALAALELESCGQAMDTIFFDYGKDMPFTVEGGEGQGTETWGGVTLTDADGNAFAGGHVADSGINRSSDGQSVFLFSFPGELEGFLVLGIAGADLADAQANFAALLGDEPVTDDLVFAVALDNSEAFTLSGDNNEAEADIWFVQFQGIENIEGDPASFSVHYTVTDGDHDTSTQEFVIEIADDVPTIDIGEFAISIDESSGLQTGGVADGGEDNNDDDVEVNTLPAVLLALGTPIEGAMKPLETDGVPLVSYDAGKDGIAEVILTDGDGGSLDQRPTQLFTLDGNRIFLFVQEDGVIVGREGSGSGEGDIDPAGDVAIGFYLDRGADPADSSDDILWISQYQPLANADGTNNPDDADAEASFFVTVVDNDGNSTTSSGSISISFEDDGPVALADTDSAAAGGTETGNVVTGAGTRRPARPVWIPWGRTAPL